MAEPGREASLIWHWKMGVGDGGNFVLDLILVQFLTRDDRLGVVKGKVPVRFAQTILCQ
jgi:hypothetical protein